MASVTPSGIKIGPEDPRYGALRRGFNPRWQAAFPEYIRLPRTGAEVKHALQEAINEPALPEKSRITVKSGGHCYEDFVCSPDVRVIIDLSLMDGVYEDPTMNAVCMESGVTNGLLYKKLFLATGKALPGGSCPSVGVGGHIAGGGFGLLSRQFGLTVDYLYAVEVAVVDQKGHVDLVTARADDDDCDLKDLWWAHSGGGGGNFGIVTRYWFRDLPEAPAKVLFATGGWRWAEVGRDNFQKIVDNFGRFFKHHQGDTTDKYADLFAILLLTHASRKEIGLIAQIDAGTPDARTLIKGFQQEINKDVGLELRPMTEAYGELTFSGLDLLTLGPEPLALPWVVADRFSGAPHNDRCGKHKSAYMREPLPVEQVDALWRGLAGDRNVPRDAVVQIDSYGSRVNRLGRHDTAVVQRDSIMKLQHQIYWPGNEDGADHLRWIRDLYADMYPGGVPAPNETTDGCFINYPDADLSDPAWNTSGVPWSTLYYGTNYPRLQRAKKRWDPNNVFRHAQSIELPA
jgi:FAD/FMN-containing dehydrogenase